MFVQIKKYWFSLLVVLIALSGLAGWFFVYNPNQTLEQKQAQAEIKTSCAVNKTCVEAITPNVLAENNGLSELGQKNKCWVVYNGQVYDISNWKYPGEQEIKNLCGDPKSEDILMVDREEPPEKYLIGKFLPRGLQDVN